MDYEFILEVTLCADCMDGMATQTAVFSRSAACAEDQEVGHNVTLPGLDVRVVAKDDEQIIVRATADIEVEEKHDAEKAQDQLKAAMMTMSILLPAFGWERKNCDPQKWEGKPCATSS